MSMLLCGSIGVGITNKIMVFCAIGESELLGACQVMKDAFDSFPMGHAGIVKKVR